MTPDEVVELVKLTLRKHPLTAWAFIVFAVLLAAVVAANQVGSFLKMVGVIR